MRLCNFALNDVISKEGMIIDACREKTKEDLKDDVFLAGKMVFVCFTKQRWEQHRVLMMHHGKTESDRLGNLV